ncbi:MAG: hypothetical protein ABSB71_13330 [Candidatus Bathyarchaeia archaeon]|jgi:hypothetical protein
MSFNEDALAFVDSAAIQYPELHQVILELTMPNLITKRLFTDDVLKSGRTKTYVKEVGTRSTGISEIAPGTAVPVDYTPLSYVTISPYKRGESVEIPKEVVEDVDLPVINQQLKRLARRLAFQIELDCITVIGSACPGANSNACTGKTITVTGTEFTKAGTPGMEDFNAAEALINKADFLMDTILCNPLQKRDIKNLPNYSLYHDVISPITQKPMQMLGEWELCWSNVIPAGTVYCISTGKNLSAAYAPLGFFLVKRPLTTDVELLKSKELVKPILTTRYAPVITNGECIAAITGCATS